MNSFGRDLGMAKLNLLLQPAFLPLPAPHISPITLLLRGLAVRRLSFKKKLSTKVRKGKQYSIMKPHLKGNTFIKEAFIEGLALS